ncbi:MAG: NAD(P)/FAD-dependent oxidoreductase [Burkholderiaceae bacterium]
MNNSPRILILGCGFGGLEAAKALRGAPVEVVLIDRTNHHLFQPLLYQVATAGLAAPAIAAPTRHIFRKQRNCTVLMKDAVRIDKAAKTVIFDDGSVEPFDALIVATGATHSYFGNDHWAQHARGLKTLDDAFAIRGQMLRAFEEAEKDEHERDAWLTFIVIGAGPTGVEMAGTMAEIARHTLTSEFRRIVPAKARVLLVEGGPRVLPTFSEKLSEKARVQLEKLGVEVRLNARVSDINAQGIAIGTGDAKAHIAAKTVVWAAGVKASPLLATLDVPLDRAGRVTVNETLNIEGREDIYVVGDAASAMSNGKPVPGVSPGAKQMGRAAAKNILARLRSQSAQPFKYVDYGALATIGRKSAVVQLPTFSFWGLPAWLFWLFVHVYFLIGFRNRLIVLMEWGWAYFTHQRYARLIFGDRNRK